MNEELLVGDGGTTVLHTMLSARSVVVMYTCPYVDKGMLQLMEAANSNKFIRCTQTFINMQRCQHCYLRFPTRGHCLKTTKSLTYWRNTF